MLFARPFGVGVSFLFSGFAVAVAGVAVGICIISAVFGGNSEKKPKKAKKILTKFAL